MKLTDKQLKLIEENSKLVTYVITKLIHSTRFNPDDYEDIYSEGRYYLCRAAAAFDEEKYTKFSPFAVKYILGGVIRYLNRNCSILYSRKIEDVRRTIKHIKIDNPELSDAEIFEMLGINDIDLYYALKPVKSTDCIKYAEGDKEITIGDTLIDDSVDVESEVIDKLDIFPDIMRCIDELTLSRSENINIKRKSILKDYLYGIYSGDKISQLELGRKYDISRQVVSNVIIEGLGKLRIKLRSEGITLDTRGN